MQFHSSSQSRLKRLGNATAGAENSPAYVCTYVRIQTLLNTPIAGLHTSTVQALGTTSLHKPLATPINQPSDRKFSNTAHHFTLFPPSQQATITGNQASKKLRDARGPRENTRAFSRRDGQEVSGRQCARARQQDMCPEGKKRTITQLSLLHRNGRRHWQAGSSVHLCQVREPRRKDLCRSTPFAPQLGPDGNSLTAGTSKPRASSLALVRRRRRNLNAVLASVRMDDCISCGSATRTSPPCGHSGPRPTEIIIWVDKELCMYLKAHDVTGGTATAPSSSACIVTSTPY